jgi:hypothetical protein
VQVIPAASDPGRETAFAIDRNRDFRTAIAGKNLQVCRCPELPRDYAAAVSVAVATTGEAALQGGHDKHGQ